MLKRRFFHEYIEKIVATGLTVSSLSSGAIALADTGYDNDFGQSAQMSHIVQDQQSRSSSQQKARMEESKKASSQENSVVEELRQRNMLGQSDAMSKSRPYGLLIEE